MNTIVVEPSIDSFSTGSMTKPSVRDVPVDGEADMTNSVRRQGVFTLLDGVWGR
jgi:hypothetical protein